MVGKPIYGYWISTNCDCLSQSATTSSCCIFYISAIYSHGRGHSFNGVNMTIRKSFFIGPLATPAVALVLIVIFCIAAGFQVGVGMLRVISLMLLGLFVWSYVFTFVFGLPFLLFFRHKGLFGWIHLNIVVVASTLLVALLMLVLDLTGDRLWILAPILFFGLCNANFTWLLGRSSKPLVA